MITKIKGYIASNFYHQKHQYLLKNSKKIIIGSCYTSQKGWFSTDYPEIDISSIDQCAKYWKENSKSAFLAEHVWEHLEDNDANIAARCCFYFLRKGGQVRVAVPDGLHPDPSYIDHVRPGGVGPGAYDHKVLFTINSLSEVFKSAGFNISPLEYWDSSGVFQKRKWDPELGFVKRSSEYDTRNSTQNPYAYTSIIIDCVEP